MKWYYDGEGRMIHDSCEGEVFYIKTAPGEGGYICTKCNEQGDDTMPEMERDMLSKEEVEKAIRECAMSFDDLVSSEVLDEFTSQVLNRLGLKKVPVKVYIFASGVFTTNGVKDYYMTALCEDGELMGSHVCSSPNYGKHDLHDIGSRRHTYLNKFGVWKDDSVYVLIECEKKDVPPEVLRRGDEKLEEIRKGEES